MARCVDLSGKRFGRLVVISRDTETTKPRVRWICKCDCGNVTSVLTNLLNSKKTESCGCLKSERIAERNTKYCTKTNEVEHLDNNTTKIYSGNMNNFCLIDTEDYDAIKRWFWRLGSNGYWVSNAKKEDNKTSVKMHQEIAKVKYGEYDTSSIFPDHLSRDKGDNRKCNLELKTNSDNMKNRSLSKSNTSGKTGVSYDKRKDKYIAYICVDYKNIYLGAFKDEIEAIKARKEAESEYGFTCDDITAEN